MTEQLWLSIDNINEVCDLITLLAMCLTDVPKYCRNIAKFVIRTAREDLLNNLVRRTQANPVKVRRHATKTPADCKTQDYTSTSRLLAGVRRSTNQLKHVYSFTSSYS